MRFATLRKPSFGPILILPHIASIRKPLTNAPNDRRMVMTPELAVWKDGISLQLRITRPLSPNSSNRKPLISLLSENSLLQIVI